MDVSLYSKYFGSTCFLNQKLSSVVFLNMLVMLNNVTYFYPNPNPNPNLNRGAIFLGDIVQTPFDQCLVLSITKSFISCSVVPGKQTFKAI